MFHQIRLKRNRAGASSNGAPGDHAFLRLLRGNVPVKREVP